MEGVTHLFYSEEEGCYLQAEDILGEKITYVVDYLQMYTELPDMEIPIVMTGNEVQVVDRMDNPYASFGYTGDEAWVKQESYKLLTSGAPVSQLSDQVELMGMDYIDGQLHVQVRSLPADSSLGYAFNVYLTDNEGTKHHFDQSVHFSTESGDEYTEWIFDIPEAEIGNYTMLFSHKQHENIEGPWRVTFPITENADAGE